MAKVIDSPRPKNKAIKSPFLYPLPIDKGTMTKAKGKVQGKNIIESPATKARVNPTVCPGAINNQNIPIRKMMAKIKKPITKYNLVFCVGVN